MRTPSKFSFCTYFDKNYLPHVLSLYESLLKNVSKFTMYCFCMDDESYQFMQSKNAHSIIAVSFQQLEDHFPELLIAKSNRSRVEYYFTCTSAICCFVFDCYPDTDLITYLDADLYFFSSPEPIYQELRDGSIGIIEHAFSFFGKVYLKYGRFNVGWVSFRNDISGRKCLDDWRKNCLNWCYDRLENGKFADQKYLDHWPVNYAGVHIIKNPGANIGPWNVGRVVLKIDQPTKQVMVNGQNLIFYHFASLKQIDTNSYVTNVSKFLVTMSGVLRDYIYTPYLKSIRKYNIIVGIEFNSKDRKEGVSSSLQNKLKLASRSFRRFIYRDNIKI